MKLALSLLVWTLIALATLYVLGPDTSRELPKPKPPPSHPKEHASASIPVAPEIANVTHIGLDSRLAVFC